MPVNATPMYKPGALALPLPPWDAPLEVVAPFPASPNPVDPAVPSAPPAPEVEAIREPSISMYEDAITKNKPPAAVVRVTPEFIVKLTVSNTFALDSVPVVDLTIVPSRPLPQYKARFPGTAWTGTSAETIIRNAHIYFIVAPPSPHKRPL
jgi:hypothetical protein